MVKELLKGDVTLYLCEVCDFAYQEKEWAEQCQQWCQQHHSCNLEITQHAVSLE